MERISIELILSSNKMDVLCQKYESLYDMPEECDGSGCFEPYNLDIRYICLSGGGALGLSYIGVLKELELFDVVRHVQAWVGTSVGAVFCTLIVLGCDSKYLGEEFANLDFISTICLNSPKNWLSSFLNYKDSLISLTTKLGITDEVRFRNWLETQFMNLGWSPSLSFKELYKIKGVNLVITTTSLNTEESLYLSNTTCPKMKIVDAVCSSILYPFFFQPIKLIKILPQNPFLHHDIFQANESLSDKLLIDGGVLNNFPLNAFDLVAEDEILGINRLAIGFTFTTVKKKSKVDNLLEYSRSFAKLLHGNIQNRIKQQPYYDNRVVVIPGNIDSISLNITNEQRRELIISGRIQTRKFLIERYNMIKEKGPLPRNIFIPDYRLRYNNISIPNSFMDKMPVCKKWDSPIIKPFPHSEMIN